MKKIMPKLLSIILALLLAVSLTLPSFANEVAEEDDKEPMSETESEMLDSNIESIGEPDTPMGDVGGNADSSVFDDKGNNYADFDFGSLQTLSGIFSSVGTYITMPKYTKANSATLKLSYKCSDLILKEVSSLTFYMNGTPFYSCPVDYKDAESTLVYIKVPLTLFKDEYNFLEIRGYLKILDDEGCTDDFMGANWINIEETTMLRVSYELLNDGNRLNYYPYPFVSLLDETGQELDVCVSDNMTNEELTAAFTILGGLAEHTKKENKINLTKLSDSTKNRKIIVAVKEGLDEKYLNLLTGSIPKEDVLVERLKDGDNDILIVTSENKDALLDGAAFLSDSSRVEQVSKSSYVVPFGTRETMIKNSELSDNIIREKYTLKEISGSGIWLYGPFHREAIVYLPVSSDYVLSSESKFTFNFRYSENLDFTRSLVTVFWGDTPIISKKLTQENATGDSITFVPPADLVGTNGSSMRIAFDLEVKDLECTPRQDQMPWAYVTENSVLYLPTGTSGEFNLANLPAPFQREGMLSDIMIVMPDTPSGEELKMAGSLMSVIGTGALPYGGVKVIKASEFQAEDSDYNIISIGVAGNNEFIKTSNDSLRFKYNESFSEFISNSKLSLEDDTATSIGVMQIIESPYAAGRAYLSVSAPNTTGIENLDTLVRTEKLRWKLADDAAVIDVKEEITTFKFYESDSEDDESPSFFQTLEENKQGGIFFIVAVGVILILLISVILVLMRVRLHNKH